MLLFVLWPRSAGAAPARRPKRGRLPAWAGRVKRRRLGGARAGASLLACCGSGGELRHATTGTVGDSRRGRGQDHRRRLRAREAQPAGRPDDVQGRERRRREGDRVRGARRRPHPRRGREHRRRACPASSRSRCKPATTRRTAPAARRRSAARSRSPGDGRPRRERRPRTAAVATYRTLRRAADRSSSSTATTTFVDAVKAGDVAEGEGALPGRPHALRADRAGGRELRRPRPGDRRARGRRAGRRSWTGFHRIEQALWVDGHAARHGARSPTSSCTTSSELAARRRGRSSSSRRRSRTARSSCSTRCRSRRSPARRSATRTSTSSTSRRTSTGAQAAFDALRPIVAREATPSWPTTIDAALRRRRPPRSSQYRDAATASVSVHRADERADTRKLSQAIDALAEPLSQVGAIVVVLGLMADPQSSQRRRLSSGGRRRRRGARRRRRRGRGAAADERQRPSRDAHGSRSTARTRPASRRRRRTGCTSPRSTSSPTAATSCATCCATWTTAAARMTAGAPAGPAQRQPGRAARRHRRGRRAARRAPDDHVRLRAEPLRLDGTIGSGSPRRRPQRSSSCRRSPATRSIPTASGGDLCVQACADDPQVAFHAVRNLARIGRGVVVMRWSQLGFGRTSSTTRSQDTPRNLMGFKDGTNNIKAEETGCARRSTSGSSAAAAVVAARRHVPRRPRIRMLIEVWDRATLADQELTIGRVKNSRRAARRACRVRQGRPRREERRRHARDPGRRAHPPRGAVGEPGHPHPPPRLLVHRRHGRAARPARRRALLHRLPCATPTAFITLQQRLGRNDALNEYISHNGSALFAVPPGAQPGGFVGESLFA